MDNRVQLYKKYYLIVSEPFEYSHPKYGYTIPCTVIDISANWLILKADDIVEINGIKGDILILSLRHSEDNICSLGNGFNVGMLYINKRRNNNLETKFIMIASLKEC